MDHTPPKRTGLTAPTNDLMFSCIFRDMGASAAMLSLVNAIRKDKGKAPLAGILNIQSQYNLIGQTASDKVGRLDVLAEAGDGTQINLEMQVSDIPGMDKRIAFYAAKILSKAEAGDDHQFLPPVSMIVIEGAGYKVNPDNRYHHSFSMRDDEPPHTALPGWAEVHKLSLPTFERAGHYDKDNLLSIWMKGFLNGFQNPEFVKEAGKMDEGLLQFAERYNLALNDPDFRRKADYIQSAEMDHNWKINAAERQGRQQGLQQGLQQGRSRERVKFATHLMYAQGKSPDETFATVPGLSKDELQIANGFISQLRAGQIAPEHLEEALDELVH